MITSLTIQTLRNLSLCEFSPGSTFNLMVGPNGAGKSSILEALHILATGRSFRTHLTSRVIQYEQEMLCIHAKLQDGSRIGVEKGRQKANRIHVNGEPARSQAEVAGLLPLQLIHPDGYELITGPAKIRRQYLDWGSFHVEHQFFYWWQRAQRVLQHRNMALRQQATRQELMAWDHELVSMANLIDQTRSAYFQQLAPVIQSVLATFLDVDVQLTYFRGWDAEESLADILVHHEQRDRALGYTQKGPQRAEIRIKVGNLPAVDVLSRGQLKLLVCAMRLAQGMDYQQRMQRPCLYLLDDLSAELDVDKRQLLLSALRNLGAQVFITSVEPEQLGDFVLQEDVTMFHVEHLVGI